MERFFGLIFQIGIVFFMLVLGYGIGHYREKKHLLELKKRKKNSGISSFPITNEYHPSEH